MNNLQEQGRAHYKRGDYQKAIDCFDRAIGRASSVQLLDNRAACYERLNDYTTALKDAKQAIQLHREDATGYLRAGRLLTKMDKHSVALEIYSHGLKSIKHVGQGYEALKKAHKATLDVVSPPKSVDPLTMLPRELAETIMQYLSFKQRVNACLVSKGWNQFIRSAPDLWSHLDLSGARTKVRSSFVSTAINIGRSKLREATLNRVYDFDKVLKALVKACPLEKLTLLQCGVLSQDSQLILAEAKYLKSIDIGADTTPIGLQDIIAKLSDQLESIRVRNVSHPLVSPCKSLTHFSATFRQEAPHWNLFQRVGTLMPNVRFLHYHVERAELRGPRIFDLTGCSHLETLDINTLLRHHDTMTLPPSIKVLRLGNHRTTGQEHTAIFHNTMMSLASLRLPLLEELAVNCGHRDDGEIGHLIRGFENGHLLSLDESKLWTKLHTLSISGFDAKFDDLDVTLPTPRVKDLRVLRLLDSINLGDEKVSWIMEALPQLRSIDVSSSDITGVGVKAIAKGKCIEEINLKGCRFVSMDAIEWARAKGLRVHYKPSEIHGPGGGRKVRY